jgi:hypothetical protein
MVNTAHVPVGDEWTFRPFRQGRPLLLAAMGFGRSLSLFPFSISPAQLLVEPAFIAGVIKAATAHISGMLKSGDNAQACGFLRKVQP